MKRVVLSCPNPEIWGTPFPSVAWYLVAYLVVYLVSSSTASSAAAADEAVDDDTK